MNMKKNLLMMAFTGLFTVMLLCSFGNGEAPRAFAADLSTIPALASDDDYADIKVYLYLGAAIGLLVQLLYSAVLIVPVVLWFLGRKGDDFTRQIRITARVDLAAIAAWLLISLVAMQAAPVKSDGWFYDVLYLLLGGARVFAAWKMRGGKGFGALFKSRGIKWYFFTAYLLMTAFVAITTLITLISYLIFAAACVVIFWILIKFDVLSMAFGGSSSSRPRDTSGPSNTCSSCRYYTVSNTCNLGNKPVGSAPRSYGCSSWAP